MRLILVVILFGLFLPSASIADQYSVLSEEFDARRLSTEEKRFLQASLAFSGTYNGLLDGLWGRGSQLALEKFSYREFSEVPTNLSAAYAIVGFFSEFGEEEWDYSYDSETNLSLLTPKEELFVRDWSNTDFRTWTIDGRSLSVLLYRSDFQNALDWHDIILDDKEIIAEPYLVRKESRIVTSTRLSDGLVTYARSEKVGNGWSTAIVWGNSKEKNILNAIAGSITVGHANKLDFEDGGWLKHIVALTLEFAEQYRDENDAAAQNSSNPRGLEDAQETENSSGSGFFVDSNGLIITNAHVVEGCANITANGAEAWVLSKNTDFDLALLKMRKPIKPSNFATFSQKPARLNSDITVVGYPLHGLLGGLNVTRGAVTSMSGLQGDAVNMQISAPVQPGNSGGPAVNEFGDVVGVVVAKLNAMRLADVTGDIPQNVNFAIRGEMVKLFLTQNDVEFEIGSKNQKLSGVDLAEKAKGFTVLISCEE